MSNARDTETSPLTPEQKQRAEALRIAASILSDRGPFTAGSLPGSRTTDDAIALADFILTGLRPAEIEDDAPEPEAGDASETVKVTECQWPGCEDPAQGATFPLRYERFNSMDVVASCGNHTGWELRAVREA